MMILDILEFIIILAYVILLYLSAREYWKGKKMIITERIENRTVSYIQGYMRLHTTKSYEEVFLEAFQWTKHNYEDMTLNQFEKLFLKAILED